MKERDYLWCLANQLLDGEEELERLCPSCRDRAMEEHCPVCGRTAGPPGEKMANSSFDWERFERLRGGSGNH